MITRQLEKIIEVDLKKKMVLLAGPRQCGKTTLSQTIAKKSGKKWTYYNWDNDEDRKLILHNQLDESSELWILDELHKHLKWRNWLKGNYDKKHASHQFLVTGSAKLDAYSRGGDSLQGRYYFHRLHPLVYSEILKFDGPLKPEDLVHFERSVPHKSGTLIKDLLVLGGFPEPFSSGNLTEANRWRLLYGSRLVRDEVRTLERVVDLDKMELLLDRLPVTIGSVLSINSLKEDLQVAFETVKSWIAIFEKLYSVFCIPPFGAPKIKAVKKEKKLYFWDWAYAETEAAKFENMVAVHLLRFTHWMADVLGEKFELRYFRDFVGHEVDFILLRKNKPWMAIEVKSKQQPLDPNLKYLLERVKIPFACQVSLEGDKDYTPDPINNCQIRILPGPKFLAQF